jgi:serine/threonine protein kinase
MTPPLDKILFLAASGLSDAEERGILLDRACGDDPILRKRIERLFEVQGVAADYFAPRPEVREAVKGGAETEEGLGARIGRYRLIDRIGAGGYGVVYLAEQCEPVRRMVALKVIRLGMNTETVIARFEAERQSLALMDHPNIARVLDAGATASGRPFFVMEFVDGEKVTDFCDAKRLDLRQRLEIFVQICLAIQHAHQKGVIHRDIKPSNILVRAHDDMSMPKVIDFGIARATARSANDDPRLTVSDQLLGTPAYMSPEMVAGGMDLDTRSDIHSLGVVLCELLTGRTPFSAERLQKLGLEEVRRVLQEEEPPSPSALLAALGAAELEDVAARRDVDGASLVRMVKGELDWIVMKAMDRDRDRRYETAYGLALDVRRFLRQEPVSAGPPDRFYRLAKFIRRNKIPFLSGMLAVLALIAGFGTSTVLFFQEKEARGEQERLRVAADVARANESKLRERAEYREMIAQAAVKISHGDIEAADRLLAKVPFGQAPPSLEAAQSYSKVGEWHVLAGRWREATDRFATVALLLASVDPSDSAAVSVTLIPAAATLCQSGDRKRYEVIRKLAIERFAGTTSPVVAEQVLKAALLLPADQPTLDALKPLASLLEHTIAVGNPELANNPRGVAWCWFALALMKYREGDDATAYSLASRCLALPDRNPSREASVRCILALVESHLGHMAEARAQLEIARPPIDAAFSQKMELGNLSSFWFDWVIARLLYREARSQAGE